MKSLELRNYNKALQAATEFFEGDMETANYDERARQFARW